jgi:lipoprotein NlpD
MEVELGMKETTMKIKNNPLRWLVLCTTLALLAACSSTKSVNHAPVEDRGTGVGSRPAPVAGPGVTDPVKPPPPGIENAGKPGYYTIKLGDTLIRIGLENGQSWRDLVRWNALDNPNRIEVGQVIRIVPPGVVPPAVAASTSTAPGVIVGAPMPPAPLPAPASGVVSGAAKAVAPTAPAATPTVTVSATATDEEIAWIWPVSGAVLVGFDDVKNKGLDLNGKAGDPVSAVADGRVVYSGAGLRGYGNLIILKHNNTYLTAYAHNQTLLVKEDQSVRKGQKIAEMGSSDADRVKLHFEIRRQGKPVDPAKYLPAR